MNVGFLCRLIDIEGAILWTWGGDLKMKEASVFWDNNELYVKHYNTVDDGFSMTVYVLNNVPSGAAVIDDPDSDADIGIQGFQIILGSCFVFTFIALYAASSKRWKRKHASSPPYYISPLNDLPLPEEEEKELTEEELEEIELERIRKESRLKTLEELIQNVTAIKSPQHVLDNTELSIEEFVPEDEREELVFGVLCNLQEEAKEKMKRDAIRDDR